MVTCDLCGGTEFEKHEGFMYCAICQTQSQEYCEQEYDYQNHEININRRRKSASSSKKQKTQNACDDGFWTSWEAFNYILYGMTEEIKKCGADEKFGDMVLKLWAAYLQRCNAAFTSKCQEKVPKLGFGFRNRDAKILYNVDLAVNNVQKRPARSKSCGSRASSASESTMSPSKRSIIVQKGKMIAADYQDYLTLSSQNISNLADETLESLGKSSDFEEEESSDRNENDLKSLKNVFIQSDFKLYRNSKNSKRSMRAGRNKIDVGVRCLGKNKLLSLIHLALLLTGSEIQLSDLLRFIRESHLSFAKVTHFFPKELKFPKKDLTYIEIVTDHIMPTHLAQRKILEKLARFLKVEEIPTPNITALIDRYCLDLNLPKQVAEFSKKTTVHFPASTASGSKVFAPNYEAWAMASVIMTLKFFLGINDMTEIFLSHLALEVNNLGGDEDSLFVFQDWQKFIECRKTVLKNFHYPTEEQLGGTPFQSSKNFLGVLMKESKDEYRNERFVRYPRYYIEQEFLDGVKEMLNGLSKPQSVACLDFKPSLTPQVANLETVMQSLSKGGSAVKEVAESSTSETVLPENILRQDFKNCNIKFALDPKSYLQLLGENSYAFTKFCIKEESTEDSFQKNKEKILFDCQARYWICRFPEKLVCNLNHFDDQVLNKTPENFQWLVKECARMLEMNVRDLYEELLRLELMLV